MVTVLRSSRKVPPLAILAYNCLGSTSLVSASFDLRPLNACTLTIAAVSVVLPWSMWPIVPTFTCGLVLANFSLAIFVSPAGRQRSMRVTGFGQSASVAPACDDLLLHVRRYGGVV